MIPVIPRLPGTLTYLIVEGIKSGFGFSCLLFVVLFLVCYMELPFTCPALLFTTQEVGATS